MKKFISLLCMVAMASTMMFSCDTSDDGSGDVEKKKEFASIEVVANERYERDMDDDNVPDVAEKLKACTKASNFGYIFDSAATIPSVNFTVKVDVNDDSDTRDYLIATVPASIIEREGGVLSNIRKYFVLFKLNLIDDDGVIGALKYYEVIKSGDVDESANLFEIYPILTCEKQCVVCIPMEGEDLKYDEASVSKPISVARLIDPNEISVPASELECTIEFENVESYDADYEIKGLDENELYLCSYDRECVYNNLSAEEVYVRTIERICLRENTLRLTMMLFGQSLEELYDVYIFDGQVDKYRDMDFEYDDTNYTLYIFSYDPAIGLPTSAIKTATVKSADYVTSTGQLKGFENLEVGINEFTVDVDNGTYEGENAYYFIESISYDEMKRYFGCTTAEEFASLYAKLLSFGGDFGFYDGYATGYEIDDLLADSEYVVVAFGMSVDGDLITNVISQDFKTLPIPDNFSVSIDLQSADVNDFCCVFTPSQDDVMYSYAIIESSEIEGMSDAEIIKRVEGDNVEWSDNCYGESTCTCNWFNAGADYTICAYVANSKGEPLMSVVTEEFFAIEAL